MSVDDYIAQFHNEHPTWYAPSPDGFVRKVKITTASIDVMLAAAFNAGAAWNSDRETMRDRVGMDALKDVFGIT